MSEVASLLEELTERFYPPAAHELDAVYQFELVDGGNFYMSIRDGQCEMVSGDHEQPSITLTLESDTFASVMEGSLSSAQAFMFGKVRVQGNIILATRLAQLFSA